MKQLNFKVLAVFVLGMAVLGAVFFAAKQKVQKPPTETTPLSKEEILHSLSPSIGPGQETFSLEEKKKILENLSAPNEAQYSPKEKNKILDSLSAPRQ